ncbi:TetR family transcriptional regulator [Amycolatopsis mediterranei S699]|uniref:TetR family transcriptional regulator n=3 Tax=Amycolatopsis mediterranei TaxID=33910 RepID=A0A0H3D329_AMYMU|nr:TetR/AcrR family transcriptional regulator [Amycolatopsis mediterranei]ADJ45350.1 TetR family transcriptional regulator [Amycolatopsis mediterranei U32]AEK42110.1 TetR family transcriptional regulator [Amycolatopsis mediterranei S699]AFO77061.1 TetR family transcriptional regulator [Amycolatopsis mediterranei S699]AGT84189.1 TetR family transcriptional regulator [Amycolatopsis mediterranei RB]KDO08466.1 TetR family transcriptional regulator [Amycolatopsis mediterranei]
MARTGRPRGFDPAGALERARGIFWASGYGGTSIQDLVDGLAVERGSLYATFGDKRQLYLEAVKSYWADYERALEPVLATIPLLPALRELLVMPARLGAAAADPEAPHGCMIGNTTAELVPQDDQATAIVRESFARFVRMVADALRAAQQRGEVTTTSAPEAQAQLLLVVAQGTSLLARAGTDPAAATAAIDVALEGLRQAP